MNNTNFFYTTPYKITLLKKRSHLFILFTSKDFPFAKIWRDKRFTSRPLLGSHPYQAGLTSIALLQCAVPRLDAMILQKIMTNHMFLVISHRNTNKKGESKFICFLLFRVLLAERLGFEPRDPVAQVNCLAGSSVRPLWHLSEKNLFMNFLRISNLAFQGEISFYLNFYLSFLI